MLIITFLVCFVFTDAWAVIPLKPSIDPALNNSQNTASLDPSTFTLPVHLGEVRYSYKGDPDRIVIHIQDAHCNYFAQKKIAEIIDYLKREYGIDVVNLEGGAGDYNLKVFTNISGNEIRYEVADYFVKKGEINGAELYAITNPGSVDLWGVEDKELYRSNLKVYRDSLSYKRDVDRSLGELTHILDSLKTRIFNGELLKIDEAYTKYKAGELDFKQYLAFLIQQARDEAIPIREFTNLYLISQAMDQEVSVDFKKANSERDNIVDDLKRSLSKNDIAELASKSLDFKTKKIKQEDFYGYLLQKAKKAGIDIHKYPSLSSYIIYVSLFDAVDRFKIMEEMDELEKEIKEPFFKNDEQRKLDQLARNLSILKNIFGITLTKNDYDYFLRNRDSFYMSDFLGFIKKESFKYGLMLEASPSIKKVDNYLREIENFYEYSFKRDDMFLENLKFATNAQGKAASVLMTGGFHTDNLCDILKDENISFVSIVPKFTCEMDYESPYFELLAGQTSGIQGMLVSAMAKSSMIQIASKLNGVLADRASVDTFNASVVILSKLIEERGPDVVNEDINIELSHDGKNVFVSIGEPGGYNFYMPLTDLGLEDASVVTALPEVKPVVEEAQVVIDKEMVGEPAARAPPVGAGSWLDNPIYGVFGAPTVEAFIPKYLIAKPLFDLASPQLFWIASVTASIAAAAVYFAFHFRYNSKGGWHLAKHTKLAELGIFSTLTAVSTFLVLIQSPIGKAFLAATIAAHAVTNTVHYIYKHKGKFTDFINSLKGAGLWIWGAGLVMFTGTIAIYSSYGSGISWDLVLKALAVEGWMIVFGYLLVYSYHAHRSENRLIKATGIVSSIATLLVFSLLPRISNASIPDYHPEPAAIVQEIVTPEAMPSLEEASPSEEALREAVSEIEETKPEAIPGLESWVPLVRAELGKARQAGTLDLTRAVIHHTDSHDVPASTIDDWHKERGFSGIGYHLVIRKDGTVEIGRSMTKKGAHALGRNDRIGIVLTGYNEFTDAQKNTLKKVLLELGVDSIQGHHENCPGPGLSLEDAAGSMILVVAPKSDIGAGSWFRSKEWIRNAFVIETGVIPVGVAASFLFPGWWVAPVVAAVLFILPHLRIDRENGFLVANTSWPVVLGLAALTAVASVATLKDPVLGVLAIGLLMMVHRFINQRVLAKMDDGIEGFFVSMKGRSWADQEKIESRSNKLKEYIRSGDEGKIGREGLEKNSIIIAGEETIVYVHRDVMDRLELQKLTLQQFIENCISIRGPTYYDEIATRLFGATIVIDALDRSPNLYGNSRQSGYIYVNTNAPIELDQIGFSHALMREIGFNTSAEDEEVLSKQDIWLIARSKPDLSSIISGLENVKLTSTFNATAPSLSVIESVIKPRLQIIADLMVNFTTRTEGLSVSEAAVKVENKLWDESERYDVGGVVVAEPLNDPVVQEALGFLRRDEDVREYIRKTSGIIFTRAPSLKGIGNVVYISGSAEDVARQIYKILGPEYFWELDITSEKGTSADDVRKKMFVDMLPVETADMLRRTTGEEGLVLDDLNGEVRLEFHDDGTNKNVFRMTFVKSDKGKVETAYQAYKKEKRSGLVTIREMDDLEKLDAAKVVSSRTGLSYLPHFGRRFRDNEGYVEEFISGETAWSLLRRGELTLEHRRDIVEAVLKTGSVLGSFPLDVHARNFIISDNGRVVFIDIGHRRIRPWPEWAKGSSYADPAESLSLISILVGLYGYQTASEGSNDFIFQLIDEVLPGGREILIAASSYADRFRGTSQKGAVQVDGAKLPLNNEVLAEYLSEGDRHKGWIKTSEDMIRVADEGNRFLETSTPSPSPGSWLDPAKHPLYARYLAWMETPLVLAPLSIISALIGFQHIPVIAAIGIGIIPAYLFLRPHLKSWRDVSFKDYIESPSAIWALTAATLVAGILSVLGAETLFWITTAGLTLAHFVWNLWATSGVVLWSRAKSIAEREAPTITSMSEPLFWTLMSQRMGVSDMDQWRSQNPDQAQILEKQLRGILGIQDQIGDYMETTHQQSRIIDGRHPRFKSVYEETETIVKDLLKAQGYDPSLFEVYIYDSAEMNAYALRYTNKIFVSLGLLRRAIANGASKDAVAMVLAHELTHINRWMDDCLEDRPINRNEATLSHGDEYDADIQAIVLMEKAGYNVKEATWFFNEIRDSNIYTRVLGLGSHPPSEERLRKLVKLIRGYFWKSKENEPKSFSDRSGREVARRTFLREFQHKVVTCRSFADLSSILSQANDMGELVFAMMVGFPMVLRNNRSEPISEGVLNTFEMMLTRFSPEGSGGEALSNFIKDNVYKRLHEFSNLPPDYNNIDTLIQMLGLHMNGAYLSTYERNTYGASISATPPAKPVLDQADILAILDFSMTPFLDIDQSYNKQESGQYSQAERIYSSNIKDGSGPLYREYVGKFCSDIVTRTVVEPISASTLPPSFVWEVMERLNKMDDRGGSVQLRELMVKVLDAFMRSQNQMARMLSSEDFLNLLNYIDKGMFQKSGPIYFDIDHLLGILHPFVMQNPNFRDVLAAWISENSRGVWRGNSVKDRIMRDEHEVYPSGILIEYSTAMEELNALFSMDYFADPGQMLRRFSQDDNRLTLQAWLDNLEQSHPRLSSDDKLFLYERVLDKLSEIDLKTEWTDHIYEMYSDIYRRMGALPERVIRRHLSHRGINVAPSTELFVLSLIYLYSLGGFLKPESMRNVFLAHPFNLSSWQVFTTYIESIKPDIERRFSLTEDGKKDRFWAVQLSPMALDAFWSGAGLQQRLSRNDQLGSPSNQFSQGGSPYVTFFGEFHAFLNNLDGKADFAKTIIDSRSGDVTAVSRLDYSHDARDVTSLFDYIDNFTRSFRELVSDAESQLPRSVYRNFVMYQLLLRKVIRPLCAREGISIDISRAYDISYMTGIIASLSGNSKREVSLELQRIAPFMVKDKAMEDVNKGLMVSWVATKDPHPVDMQAYQGEISGYADIHFFDVGGPVSQMDVFMGLIDRDQLIDTISGSASFRSKLDSILLHFPRASNTRDELLVSLSGDSPTYLQLRAVLPHINNVSLKDRYSLETLELERVEHPEYFNTLEGELERVTSYFALGFTRDDILRQIENTMVMTPDDLQKIEPLYLDHPNNIRQKDQARVYGGMDVFRVMLDRMNSNDKKDFLLWILGITDQKTGRMIDLEFAYKVNMDSLRDTYTVRSGAHYRNVGKSAREDFIVSFLYGETGIFTDDTSLKDFFDSLFNTVLPGHAPDSAVRVVYDSVFMKRQGETLEDELRRERITMALLQNLAEADTAQTVSADEKEAKAIRAFLESMGVVGVKLGQFLSTFGFVGPGHLRNELNRLKDDAKPVGKGVVFDMLAKIYGSFSSKFRELNELEGSASIKSVYRATLSDGKDVVVKVKRPEAEDMIERELGFLSTVLSETSVRTALARQNIVLPDNIISRLKTMIMEEMNFDGEMRNQKRLASNIGWRRFPLHKLMRRLIISIKSPGALRYTGPTMRVRVPVASEVSNNALMIEERVEGIKLTTIEKYDRYLNNELAGDELSEFEEKISRMDPQEVNILDDLRSRLGEIRSALANELVGHQIVREGFYHADPHSGNIFVSTDGGTLYLIDIGAASKMPLSDLNRLNTLMTSVINSDVRGVIGLFSSIGGPSFTITPQIRTEITDIVASADPMVTKILEVFHLLDTNNIEMSEGLMSVFRFFAASADLLERTGVSAAGTPAAQSPAPGSWLDPETHPFYARWLAPLETPVSLLPVGAVLAITGFQAIPLVAALSIALIPAYIFLRPHLRSLWVGVPQFKDHIKNPIAITVLTGGTLVAAFISLINPDLLLWMTAGLTLAHFLGNLLSTKGTDNLLTFFTSAHVTPEEDGKEEGGKKEKTIEVLRKAGLDYEYLDERDIGGMTRVARILYEGKKCILKASELPRRVKNNILPEAEIIKRLNPDGRNPHLPVFVANATDQNGVVKGIILESFEDEGVNLRTDIKRGTKYDDIDAVDTAIMIAEVLSNELHANGIIHKDIKPANIHLIYDRKGVILFDFGISASIDYDWEKDTRKIRKGGTDGYRPKDIIEGKAIPDFSDDLYSLGATLHYMVTGKHLPKDYIMGGKIPKSFDKIEPSIREVIAKATSYERDDRYKTASEMIDALVLCGEEVSRKAKERLYADLEAGVILYEDPETGEMRKVSPEELQKYMDEEKGGTDSEEETSTPSQAAESLIDELQRMPVAIQLEAMKQVLHNRVVARDLAKAQYDAYYIGIGQVPPEFITAAEEDTPAADRKIAQSLAGIYAFECGIGHLSRVTGRTPVDVIKSTSEKIIAAGKDEKKLRELAEDEDIKLLMSFTNGTWAASQPFIGMERIKRVKPFEMLSWDEKKKDIDQIAAAARSFYEAMTENIEEGLTDAERKDLIEQTESLIGSLDGISVEEAQKIRETAQTVMYAHRAQRRRTGEPYFTHQLEVARTLIKEFGVTDPAIIQITLLHDTREDQEMFYTDFRTDLREVILSREAPEARESMAYRLDEISLGVRMLSKLEGEKYEEAYPDADERNREYYRRMLDPRSVYDDGRSGSETWYTDDFIHKVQLVKLSDRLSNLRDLRGLPPVDEVERQKKYPGWTFSRGSFEKTLTVFIPEFVANMDGVLSDAVDKFYRGFEQTLMNYEGMEGDAELRQREEQLISAAKEALPKLQGLMLARGMSVVRGEAEASTPSQAAVEGGIGIASDIVPESVVGRITQGITTPDRNIRLDAFIKKYLEDNGLDVGGTVVDIGVGYPPVTTLKMAQTLEKSNVIGVDINIPVYVVEFAKNYADTYMAFFNEKNEIIFIMARHGATYSYSEITEKAHKIEREKAVKEALKVRDELMTVAGGQDIEEGGQKIVFDPVRKFGEGQSNLSFVRGGFELPIQGQADVVRSTNVFMYYSPEEAQDAVRSIGLKIKENGILIVGNQGSFLVFRKINGQMILDELVSGVSMDLDEISNENGNKLFTNNIIRLGNYRWKPFPQYEAQWKNLDSTFYNVVRSYDNWEAIKEEARQRGVTINALIAQKMAERVRDTGMQASADSIGYVHLKLQVSPEPELPTPSKVAAITRSQKTGYSGAEKPTEGANPVKLINILKAKQDKDKTVPVVVDLGSGEGPVSGWMYDQGMSVLGLDIQSENVERARNIASANGQELITANNAVTALEQLRSSENSAISYQEEDLANGIPLPDNSVDAIVLHRVLSQIIEEEARNRLLQEIYRVLKPDGVFSYLDYSRRTGEESWEKVYEKQQELISLLLEAGRLPEEVRTFLDNPDMQLHIVYNSLTGRTKLEEEYDAAKDIYDEIVSGETAVKFIVLYETTDSLQARLTEQGFQIVEKQESKVPGKNRGDSFTPLSGFIARKGESLPTPPPATSEREKVEQMVEAAFKERSDLSEEEERLRQEFFDETAMMARINLLAKRPGMFDKLAPVIFGDLDKMQFDQLAMVMDAIPSDRHESRLYRATRAKMIGEDFVDEEPDETAPEDDPGVETPSQAAVYSETVPLSKEEQAEQFTAEMSAALKVLGDVDPKTTDWVITPGSDDFSLAAREKEMVDRKTEDVFNKRGKWIQGEYRDRSYKDGKFAWDTRVKGYTYSGKESDEELRASFKDTFANVWKEMNKGDYIAADPRAIVFVPGDKRDIAMDVLYELMEIKKPDNDEEKKEAELKVGKKFVVARVPKENISESGLVDEVNHVNLGKGLLRYKRGLDQGVDLTRETTNLMAYLEVLAGPGVQLGANIIKNIINGLESLPRMRPVDIDAWRVEQDARLQILHSL